MVSQGRIEHVNICVSDIDRAAGLFTALLGWEPRWRGPAMNDGETLHLGTRDTYLALYRPKDGKVVAEEHGPFNHVGLEVDDIDAAEAIVTAHGLVPYNHGDYEPGRRFYFADWDATEYEVVSYA